MPSFIRRRLRQAILAAVAILHTATVPVLAGSSADPPLIRSDVARALAEGISGANAKRIVQELTLHHRMRGSRGFRSAARVIRDRAKEYGLQQVEIIELPADGKIMYGTQRSRPAWDADFAELWEMEPREGSSEEAWAPARLIASWEARPVTLAQDSASGRVTADLVDVGAGTNPADYQGKDLRGKLALTSSQPGPVSKLAVDEHGASGIVSYAQNQKSAWWREDETLVRWGHLETFPEPSTFAFMVSLKQARAWQERLAKGDRVVLRAVVDAGQRPGAYLIPTAVIPGTDPGLTGQQIVFSCHLDHLRPGANDNASGCATILEVGRTLAGLVRARALPPPRRTIRFVWPAEIEGTIALLNARPEMAARTVAVIHMDMVGGDSHVTKAVSHVTRSPKSLPSFVNDVAEALGRFVNEQTDAFAGGSAAGFPLNDPEGGKEAFQAAMADFSLGSDHAVWTEGSFRVPAIYLNDWPDRTIHTHADSVANIDATKLKRAAFIGAASAWYLARMDSSSTPALWEVIRRHALERRAGAMQRAAGADRAGAGEGGNLLRFQARWERAVLDSIERFTALPSEVREPAEDFLDHLDSLAPGGGAPPGTRRAGEPGGRVYVRTREPRGPMSGFGYSYLADHMKRMEIPEPDLMTYEGLWGSRGEYTYEALNLVDGDRTVAEVRDDLSAIYGPVPLEMVAGYLEVLEKIGILE
jgi:hypothetical protein